MGHKLLESFRQAYRDLELFPLVEQKQIADFRVDYGTLTIAKLEQAVADSASTGKFIFAGHRGCGKSTLLARFCQRMENEFFVVLFSIADLIEMSDVNHINILFAIAVKVMEKAEAQQIEIPSTTKATFYRWFAEQTRIETDQVSAQLSGGYNLFEIIKAKLQADATIRNEIKTKFERRVSELVNQIDLIAATVRAAANREILVVIDDLDKLDLAMVDDIYKNNVKALFQPKFRIVFTIPISVIRNIELKPILESETGRRIDPMPVSKLFKQGENRNSNAIPIDATLEVFLAVLKKRIPVHLIEPDTACQIVIKSGGVMRELIRIARECCAQCLLQLRSDSPPSEVKINSAILKAALTDLRNDFAAPLGKTQYEILAATYESFAPEDTASESFLQLLHGLYVLEYRNDDLWYDVHPIVTDLLQRKELI
ncbi:MAG: AAA family ATPase [Cyanothece sp. SIO1E1]|nr:AAA family ATPase [Cyanothece sp. SIO1E1]